MFEHCRQTFYPPHKTFAKKSVLSANKFVTLWQVNALYVRVEIFAKQFIFNGIQYYIPLLFTIIAVNRISKLSHIDFYLLLFRRFKILLLALSMTFV